MKSICGSDAQRKSKAVLFTEGWPLANRPGFELFETESLRYPGFVEFDDVNGKVLTYSAAGTCAYTPCHASSIERVSFLPAHWCRSSILVLQAVGSPFGLSQHSDLSAFCA